MQNEVEKMLFAMHKAMVAIEEKHQELMIVLSPNRNGSFSRGAAERGLNIAMEIQTLLDHGQFVEWIPENKSYGFKDNFERIKYQVKELYERRSKEYVGSGTTIGEVSASQTETL